MKILALNGSPRMKASSTYHMLTPLLEGMEAEGASVEVVHLRKLDLKACIGCYTCWVRTPGKCIFHDKDKMISVLDSYNDADMVIFGTPLYHFTMSGIMKDFIDRTLVRIEPWLIPHPDLPDTTFHPERFHKPKKMMLVSPCGFPEFEHFDSLTATFKQMARMERMEYVGEILRPAAETLSRKTHQGLFGAYYEQLRRAGSEIMRNGAISEPLMEELKQDLFPGGKEVFYGLAENYWTEQMDRFKVPDEERRVAPILASDLDATPYVPEVISAAEPDSGQISRATNKLLMEYLSGMFNPKAIQDLRATIQFVFSQAEGDSFNAGPADWYLNIGEGNCSLHQGSTAVPTLTVSTPNEIWQLIGSGQLDAEEAFTNGDFEAEGSMKIMSQFPDIFQYPKPDPKTSLSGLDTTMLGMPDSFQPEQADGLIATIQFVLGGTGGGIYHLNIKDKTCTAHRGAAAKTDLTINAPAQTWLAISNGDLDGQKAFMSGAYRATGDMEIMMRFGSLFATRDSNAADGIPKSSQPGATNAPTTTRSCRDTIEGMVTRFEPTAVEGITGDLQFRVEGTEPGDYVLAIANGECAFSEGLSAEPALTITTPSEVWVKISTGEIAGQTAFMEQLYVAEGDFSILLKMSEIFPT